MRGSFVTRIFIMTTKIVATPRARGVPWPAATDHNGPIATRPLGPLLFAPGPPNNRPGSARLVPARLAECHCRPRPRPVPSLARLLRPCHSRIVPRRAGRELVYWPWKRARGGHFARLARRRINNGPVRQRYWLWKTITNVCERENVVDPEVPPLLSQ